jgi:hypothetical protein
MMNNSYKRTILLNSYKKYLFSDNHLRVPKIMKAILQKNCGDASTLYLGQTETPVSLLYSLEPQ